MCVLTGLSWGQLGSNVICPPVSSVINNSNHYDPLGSVRRWSPADICGSCKDTVRTFSAAEKFNRLDILGEAMMIKLKLCRQFTCFLCKGSGPYFPTLHRS